MSEDKVNLSDFVTAEYDGYYIILAAKDGSRIVLTPTEVTTLIQFVAERVVLGTPPREK